MNEALKFSHFYFSNLELELNHIDLSWTIRGKKTPLTVAINNANEGEWGEPLTIDVDSEYPVGYLPSRSHRSCQRVSLLFVGVGCFPFVIKRGQKEREKEKKKKAFGFGKQAHNRKDVFRQCNKKLLLGTDDVNKLVDQ